MNETNMARIDATFEQLHQDAAEAYRNVYDGIHHQLKTSTSHGLSGEIAQLEAKNLNQKILWLTEDVKQAAMSEMIACGCKPYLTQAGWTEIQQVAGLPQVELCKIQVDAIPHVENPKSTGVKPSRNRELEELARQYGETEKVWTCIAGVGATAAVVSLIIPGWDLPVKILCVAGVIIAVLSGSGAIYYNGKRNECVSKFDHVGKPAAPEVKDGMQLDSLIKKITDSQCERNFKLYYGWLKAVKQALVSECDKLAAM